MPRSPNCRVFYGKIGGEAGMQTRYHGHFATFLADKIAARSLKTPAAGSAMRKKTIWRRAF
jgi:hypothetical protein